MLISNGFITRNIAEKQLPEYLAKGYAVVEKATAKPPKTPTKKTGGK